MLLSVILSLFQAALTLLMAYLGMHVTLHPVGEESRNRRRAYKVGFVLCALASLGLVTWQGVRNGLSTARFQRQLDKIQHNTETPPHVSVTLPPIVIPPPKVIENRSAPPPSSPGNLRDRLADESQKIDAFIRFRIGAEEGMEQRLKPGENRWDVYGPWVASTASGFDGEYLPDVVALRNEAAGLHVIDPHLDEDLRDIIEVERASQNSTSNNPRYFPGIDQIQDVADRLAVLSTEVK